MSQKLSRLMLAVAALLLALATALGAVASHALYGVLTADALASFATAVDYQFFHSLGLLAIAVHADRRPQARSLLVAALALLAGIVLFCGGLYASSLDGPDWIGSLAPVGGISLMAGWVVVALGAIWSFIKDD